MVKHDFKVKTHWTGGRESIGTVEGDILNERISIPSSLGGNGTGTNPDEMLVSAASSCYIISLAAALERARFDNITIKNESIGTAQFNQDKFSMIRIVHKPTIFIDKLQSNRLQQRISKLTQIADEHCMISNSIRGNIEIIIEPTIAEN